jgi:hypothetical protein
MFEYAYMPAAISAIEQPAFAGRSGNRQESRFALDQQVIRLLVSIRTVSTIARDVADNQLRVLLAQGVVAQAQPVRRARRKVLHQHVRIGHQRIENLRGFRLLDIKRQAFLRAVGPRAKSPVPGRSILITRAPRSASWRVQKGAAIACSSVMTLMPSSGLIIQNDRGKPRMCSATYERIRFVEMGAT